MSYPGDPGLDPKVQQRILTAFGEAARLYREGYSEEARTILRSILEVDPKFAPGERLDAAIVSGTQVDLGQLLGAVTAAAPLDPDALLAKAREALAQRDLQAALTLTQSVLRELPGHPGARALALEIQSRQRGTSDVEAHLARAREALDAGLVEEARSFLNLARNADANHPGIAELERRAALAAKPVEVEPEFEFEVFDHTAEGEPEPRPVPPVEAPEPVPPQPRTALPPSAAAPEPLASAAPPAAPPPQPGAPAFAFDETGGSPAFTFASMGEAAAIAAAPPEAAPAAGEDNASRIQALLDQGQGSFDHGDFQGAIDTWSRIYLIDAHHAEAERRIEQARRRREESDRLAEHRFYEAKEAFEQGRLDEASALCQEVLHLQPQHLEAHDLLVRLETPTAPPPPPPAEAPEDEDLFRDDFVPARISSSEAVPVAAQEGEVPRRRAAAAERAVAVPRRRAIPVPLPLLAAIVGLLVVVAGAGFLLRGRVFPGKGSAVSEALAEAEGLAKQGRLQEAVTLLQSVQGQVEGEPATQLNQRILDYQRRLKATTAPARKVDVGPIVQALGAGERVKASRLIREALAKAPGDPELLKLQLQITGYSPLLPSLADAVAGRKWDSVRQLAGQLVKEHPDDAEAQRLWGDATFNQAVMLLRQYQVPAAHALLEELARQSSDENVLRLKEFAKSYLSRPTDPRYQIYVTNVELRVVE